MSLTKKHFRNAVGALTASVAIAALLATSLATSAGAREGEHGMRHDPAALFEKADADGDGKVTKEEFAALRGDRFGDMDADGDGVVSKDELIAKAMERAERRAEHMLERMDENEDGAISADEFAALSEKRGGRMFERIDANGDGAIDKAEVEEMRFKHRHHDREHGRHGPDEERPER